uniref:Uncharacterized protein n=1 Tax=Arundo donax TaxID=35708 RepID=A0A0A9F5J8_ARUDO
MHSHLSLVYFLIFRASLANVHGEPDKHCEI